jgi:hypothetical protein
MAKQQKTMKIKVLKSFMYQQKEVTPEDTKQQPLEVPVEDGTYFNSCDLAEDYTESAAAPAKKGKAGKAEE